MVPDAKVSSQTCLFYWGPGQVVPAIRVTRLGEILPFGQFFMALGKIFSRKNCPVIWAKF